MTRYEKIQFIKSSKFLSFAYLNLDGTSDEELDQMIRHIVNMLQLQEVSIRANCLREFTVYLN